MSDNTTKLPDQSHVVTNDNVEQHLEVDPNDPRRVPPAETGFSLNNDDPEQESTSQNPLK